MAKMPGTNKTMGFDFGLENPRTCFKQKNRWLFIMQDISAKGIPALPPARGARPSLTFKETEAQHLHETIYYPSKPDWKPINLTLYDIKKEGAITHPIFDYLKKYYDPGPGLGLFATPDKLKVSTASLELYDGCGNTIETWTFENVYASSVEFGELDMSTSDVLYCDLTIRYDRAFYV